MKQPPLSLSMQTIRVPAEPAAEPAAAVASVPSAKRKIEISLPALATYVSLGGLVAYIFVPQMIELLH